MAIAAVGSLFVSDSGDTITVTPVSIGDVLVLFYTTSAEFSILDSVSGGGVASWTIAATISSPSLKYCTGVAWGVVTATGSSVITVVNAGASYSGVSLGVQEFTGGSSGLWTQDGTGGTTASATRTFSTSSLTPSTTSELYVGGAQCGSKISSDSTAGFTYVLEWGGSTTQGIAYYIDPPSGTAISAGFAQASSSDYSTSAVLIAFKPASTSPGRPNIIPSQAVQRASNY